MPRKALLLGRNAGHLRWCWRDCTRGEDPDGLGHCDVRKMRDALQIHGYETLIVGPHATHGQISDRLSETALECSGGTLVFYFSGHAVPTGSDLRLVLGSSGGATADLLASQVIGVVAASPASAKLLVLDCCYAGEATGSWHPGIHENLRILAATDRVTPGKELDDLGGVFTHLLWEALTLPEHWVADDRGVIDRDGAIWSHRLSQWLKARVRRLRDERGLVIGEPLEYAGSDRQQVVIARIPPEDRPSPSGARPRGARTSGRSNASPVERRERPAEDRPERPPSRCTTPERQALSDGLDEALAEEERLICAGTDTRPIRTRIVELKRQLRASGRLRAGDVLLQRWKLLDELGHGGFATVFKAWDIRQRRLVAVKALHAHHGDDKSRIERFVRGARKMAELQHPGIVRVLEPDLEEDGKRFFVMDYLPGGDLRQAVLAGRVDASHALDLVLDVGDALAYAHSRGIIHRDIKPANIVLDADGNPQLTDFDLVRAEDTSGGTQTAMFGTFGYAAPELLMRPQDADSRVDVYGLGMTALFAHSGADLPIPQIWRDKESFINNIPVREAVKLVLSRSVAWEADERHRTVVAFCTDLRQAINTGDLNWGAFLRTDEPRRESVQAEVHGVPSSIPPQLDLPDQVEIGGPIPDLRDQLRDGSEGPLMVWLPSGVFTMGQDDSPSGDEKPAHRVRVDAFSIGQYPVTFAEYDRFCESTGRDRPRDRGRADRPVVLVSWDDTQAYCDWLSGQTGECYRLLTEAEWEYACRAGSTARWCVGDDESQLADYAWYAANAGGRTHPVGRKRANAWHLYDMHGNVGEWCADWHAGDYYKQLPSELQRRASCSASEAAALASGSTADGSSREPPVSDNPGGPGSGSHRVIRGGAWSDDADYCRSACRDRYVPTYRRDNLGFRLSRIGPWRAHPITFGHSNRATQGPPRASRHSQVTELLSRFDDDKPPELKSSPFSARDRAETAPADPGAETKPPEAHGDTREKPFAELADSIKSIVDLEPVALRSISSGLYSYPLPSGDGKTRSKPAFVSHPERSLSIDDLKPLRAQLVRKVLAAPGEELVDAFWKAMNPRAQMAFALLHTGIFCTRREYLEGLHPDHDWAAVFDAPESECLVDRGEDGFCRVSDRLQAKLADSEGLLDQARDCWLKVLIEHEGFWDLDMARCLHLFTRGDREQAIEIAHDTVLDLEGPLALELSGVFLHQVDTRQVRRSLSRHHRLLLDDAVGIHHLRLGEYAMATKRFQAMLKDARRVGDGWAVVEALLHLGGTAHAAGDEAQAASYYRRSIEEARQRDQALLLGRALHNLSQCLFAEDPEQARVLLAESTEIKRHTGDGSPFALWMANGLMAAETNDPAAALKCFLKAEVAVGAEGYRGERARALHNQANALADLEQLDEALEKGAEALALARELQDPELLRLTVQGQAVRLAQHGDSREAIPLFDELADLKGTVGDLPGRAIVLSDGAVMRLRIGETNAAMQCFIEARHVAEAAGAELELAKVLHNHAWGVRDGGDPAAATQLLSQEYRKACETSRWCLAAELARELADENRRSGGAIEHTDKWYRSAIDAARQARDPERQVFLMGQRLACLRDANRSEDASNAVRELLDVTHRTKRFAVEHAAACLEAGNLCIDQGDLDQAKKHYRAGLKALEGQSDRRQRALLLGNLGELERRRGNLDVAERYMREGLELIPSDERETRFHAMHNLALVLDDSGRRPEAAGLLEQIRDRSKTSGDWESHARAWIELGSIAWDLDRPGLAIKRWRRALEVAESSALLRYAVLAGLELARAYLEGGELERAATVLSRLEADPPRDLVVKLATTYAEVLSRQGHLEEAASSLLRGLEGALANLERARLRSALAGIRGEQGRFDDAWSDWEAAFSLTESSDERRAIYLDGVGLALRQDEGILREDGRTEALLSRIRNEPDRPLARSLSYTLSERLWESDPEGASLIHFVTMTEGLANDGLGLDDYLADGFRLFHRLIARPSVDALAECVCRRVILDGSPLDAQPSREQLLWPFRMAKRHLSSADAPAAPTDEQIGSLFQSVWEESAHASELSNGNAG